MDTPGLVLSSLLSLSLRPSNHFKSPCLPHQYSSAMKLRCVCVISHNGLQWSMDWRGHIGGKVTAFFFFGLEWDLGGLVCGQEQRCENATRLEHIPSECPFDKVGSAGLAVTCDYSVALQEVTGWRMSKGESCDGHTVCCQQEWQYV